MMLWKTTADDLAVRCCTSATRDFKTVSCRFEHEGLSFLTITLTDFGKDLQKGLNQGFVDHDLFTGFRFRGGLPQFLGGFLDRVFDRTSGVLLDDPDTESIYAIRQLTLMYGKLLVPCSERRVRKAFRDFIECENDVRKTDDAITDQQWSDFERVSDLLFAGMFTEVDRKVYSGDLLPKHGPGATADYLRGNAKYMQNTWPARLERVLPAGEYLLPNWSFYDQLEGLDIVEPGQELPVRVVAVPKTLKTPRIIAIEPTAMQYAQQAVLGGLLEAIKGNSILDSLIGFDDQTPNQRMAQQGSYDGTLATLDLSEASDRVSNQLVRRMLRNHPHLFAAVDASRSRKADVPGEGVVRLSKFASMGSALCFPFEAMVFTTLIFLGIEKELSTTLGRRDLYDFSNQVRVYGDDLIVPVEHVRSIVETLTTFGSKVGLGKSFWNGKFRESCGKEYYDGVDVSIVKVRRLFPARSKNAQEVVSLVSLRNQMYYTGLWKTAAWLDEKIRKLLKYFPMVLPTSPVLGRHSFLGFESQGLDPNLQSPVVRGFKVVSETPPSPLEGSGALLKCLLILERRDPSSFGLPTDGELHLERSGRPRVVNIKLVVGSPV